MSLNVEMNHHQKHLSDFSDCQDSNAGIKWTDSFVKSFFIMVKVPSQTFKEKVKRVFAEKCQFQDRDQPIFPKLLELSDYQVTSARSKIDSFLFDWFFQKRKFSIGTLMEEIELMVTKK